MDIEEKNIPANLIPKIEGKSNKDRKLSLRITGELYEHLESVAVANKMSINNLVNELLKEKLNDFESEYFKAYFYNGVSKRRLGNSIKKLEAFLPEQFRQFSNAKKRYPTAKAMSDSEVNRHFIRILEENNNKNELLKKLKKNTDRLSFLDIFSNTKNETDDEEIKALTDEIDEIEKILLDEEELDNGEDLNE